ncbi:MAG: DUF1905 domain-containing protein [Devosia sp.]|uniref:DUF1905 domain-containing protein n=1 Tax=Devosia sp. TaxID=1871048 RepID=UPI0024C5B3CE|nr:DUF1905 domain-containing protein [Devosia sp.]UYN99213.1 MAG: DUF1905 domain-containing protein [Devosia sp.]
MGPFSFAAKVVYWRGPAPFIFAAVPSDIGAQIQAVSNTVSYGWGCIAVEAQIGGHGFTTALIPRDGSYLLPLKVAVRQKLPPIEIGDSVDVVMQFAAKMPPL